jgi:hypothetical protein
MCVPMMLVVTMRMIVRDCLAARPQLKTAIIARIRRYITAAALAKALSSGWATTRSARKEGLFRFSRACRHEHKGGFYCGVIIKLTSIR